MLGGGGNHVMRCLDVVNYMLVCLFIDNLKSIYILIFCNSARQLSLSFLFSFSLSFFQSLLLIILFLSNTFMLAICYLVRWDESVKANSGETHKDLHSCE